MYSTKAKLDEDIQKMREEEEKLSGTNIYYWFELMNKTYCHYDDYSEYVRADGVKYFYKYPNEPSKELKIALIKLAIKMLPYTFEYYYMKRLINGNEDIFLEFKDEIDLVKHENAKLRKERDKKAIRN
jgi:hypothetical protein